MLTVHVSITGLDKAQNDLGKLKDALKGFEPEYKAIGDMLMNYLINQVFDTEGGILGFPWSQLTDTYALYKAQKFGDQKILVATGQLRAGWKLYTSSDAMIIQNEATNDRGDYYGAFHQDGTYKMPKRQIMAFNNSLLNEIRDIAVSSINRRVKDLF